MDTLYSKLTSMFSVSAIREIWLMKQSEILGSHEKTLWNGTGKYSSDRSPQKHTGYLQKALLVTTCFFSQIFYTY